jgi:hypothetical protein
MKRAIMSMLSEVVVLSFVACLVLGVASANAATITGVTIEGVSPRGLELATWDEGLLKGRDTLLLSTDRCSIEMELETGMYYDEIRVLVTAYEEEFGLLD